MSCLIGVGLLLNGAGIETLTEVFGISSCFGSVWACSLTERALRHQMEIVPPEAFCSVGLLLNGAGIET